MSEPVKYYEDLSSQTCYNRTIQSSLFEFDNIRADIQEAGRELTISTVMESMWKFKALSYLIVLVFLFVSRQESFRRVSNYVETSTLKNLEVEAFGPEPTLFPPLFHVPHLPNVVDQTSLAEIFCCSDKTLPATIPQLLTSYRIALPPPA